MPLVFVHGVATRQTSLYKAQVVQRDALFRSMVFKNDKVVVENPDWGSFAVQFSEDLRWIPAPKGNQAFGGATEQFSVEDLDGVLDLGQLALLDAQQAVDLVAMAALDVEAREASELDQPGSAASGDAIKFAVSAGEYLNQQGVIDSISPIGIGSLQANSNSAFAEALEAEIKGTGDTQAYAVGGWIRDKIGQLGGLIGNGLSDAALRAKRRDLSRSVSYFLGDIFVYLRGRDNLGPAGTRAQLFEPIIASLASAMKAQRNANEPFVVVGHSLGGVLLYDMLTDNAVRQQIEERGAGPIKIDALFTVGSQPGFFADLGLYAIGRPTSDAKLPMPEGVERWLNVFDFTDVFSFRCEPMFDRVEDFGYDTVTDLLHAHSAYFQRPSFYERMRKRLFDQ